MNSYIRLTADTEMVAVATSALNGQALAFAVAVADQPTAELSWCFRDDGSFGNIWTEDHGCYRPDRDWDLGGPLIQKYGVLLSPKEALIHVHGGPNAGWRESGYWGATIFRKGERRRKAHNHPDEPLVAAMRCVVGWALGEVVRVPVELVQKVQS